MSTFTTTNTFDFDLVVNEIIQDEQSNKSKVVIDYGTLSYDDINTIIYVLTNFSTNDIVLKFNIDQIKQILNKCLVKINDE